MVKFTGQQSPVSSEAATTARASSIVGQHEQSNGHSLRRSTLGRRNAQGAPAGPGEQMGHQQRVSREVPVLNPLYAHHSHELASASPSNDNVLFRERKDFAHLGFSYLGEQSPVETTTEL